MVKLSRAVALAVSLTLGGLALGVHAEEPLKFNRDIRPILAENCYLCHGPDHNKRKADLRLDRRESAVSTGREQAAIVPGNPDASSIIQHIFATDPDELMPPPESERQLSAAQKETLRRWVAEGAEYEPHWSYTPVRRPEAPATAHPAAIPIDAFILRQLEQKAIEPAPEADRATLLRRLSFDLLGLPPTPEDIAAFAADSAPGAYERQVDRLLASPHFGERLAMDWLDLVRYADTNGYHGDEYRSIYPYRDYVIDAFNSNMPFDQFTREQIAGDLLPNATREQKIASGYNRLNQITAEGGAQEKEYRAIYAADRVRTTTSVWLGATMGCAQCHDHKYDPYTAKDFYSFAAFFADVDERGVYGAGGIWEPVMYLPDAAQQTKLDEFDTAIAAVNRLLDETTPESGQAYADWLGRSEQEALQPTEHWTPLSPASLTADIGAAPLQHARNLFEASAAAGEKQTLTVSGTAPVQTLTAIRLEALAFDGPGNVNTPGNGAFKLTGIAFTVNGQAIAIQEALADFEQPETTIAGAIDADPNTGWAIQRHEKSTRHEAIFYLAAPLAVEPGAVLSATLQIEGMGGAAVHEYFRLQASAHPRPELPLRKQVPRDVIRLLRKAPASRTAEENASVRAAYATGSSYVKGKRAELARLTNEKAAYQRTLVSTLVSQPVEPRVTRILARGNWMDESGPIVEPAVPEFLSGLDTANRRANRLDLAEWIVRKDNPLTARVYVNRLWKLCFGTGLSKVLDDLGAQGELPSHPELLDWLGGEFMESGWDIKHMVRLIVTSGVYRQSSARREELLDIDPYNRLLARQSQFRLPAELLRDNALAVSGLLAGEIGGRSVYPYQPEGYYANCNTFTGPLIYTPDQGANQYRRGLYTIWKRSFLHPSMLAFDAPTREECTAERPISNTPLQALVLLNDPTYVEAARALATRMYQEGGAEVSDRITWAFKRLLSREPSEAELVILAQLYAKHRAAFGETAEAATALVEVGFSAPPADIPAGELAGWTSVARALLNLHESITRT
ncbi:MAG: PSD1 domain-containing protein [Candidatus Hydrogenedentes bacterium]|nr:PSD1 domain-containing protein [Candidatus Hydrogenedentota bacterium]